MLSGFGSAKACYIITSRQDRIARRIMTELNRGASFLPVVGAYSGAARTMIISVVSSAEVLPLKRIVRQEDDRSFVFITDTHETLGEGFTSLSDE